MALFARAKLQPPFRDAPLAGDDQFSKPWVAHHQDVTDRINDLPVELTTGVTDGSDASAGRIGEYVATDNGVVGLASGVITDIASLPMAAGDWEVWGQILFKPAVTTHPLVLVAGLSAATGVITEYAQLALAFTVGASQRMLVGPFRYSTAAAGSIFLVGRATFTTSTMDADGVLSARRMR